MSLVYSTNPEFMAQNEDTQSIQTLSPDKQRLVVSIDRRNRGGKQVTLVKGFVGSDEDLSALARVLKSKCGVGGAAKEGEILIQGDFREKVTEILQKNGYGVKRGN